MVMIFQKVNTVTLVVARMGLLRKIKTNAYSPLYQPADHRSC